MAVCFVFLVKTNVYIYILKKMHPTVPFSVEFWEETVNFTRRRPDPRLFGLFLEKELAARTELVPECSSTTDEARTDR